MGFFDNPKLQSGEILGDENTPKSTDDQVARTKVAIEKFVAELENIYPGEKVNNLVYSLAPISSFNSTVS